MAKIETYSPPRCALALSFASIVVALADTPRDPMVVALVPYALCPRGADAGMVAVVIFLDDASTPVTVITRVYANSARTHINVLCWRGDRSYCGHRRDRGGNC